MRHHFRTAVLCAHLLLVATRTEGEVLVRWTERHVPPKQVLGVEALLIPATSGASVLEALTQGYRVYVEVLSARAATFRPPSPGLAGVVVKGKATGAELAGLKQRLGARVRVRTLEERGKWPGIRANFVTMNNEVLQVAGRSAQPWIDTNAALIRIASAASPDPLPLLMYEWAGATLSEREEGPALENYLLAVAEARSFGSDVVLPLHDRFQRNLLLGDSGARRDWTGILRYIEFYSADLSRQYEPITSVGVVTSMPLAWFEVMNLLARHNLPVEVIAPSQLAARPGPPPEVVVVLEELNAGQAGALAELERKGSVVKTVTAVPEPNAFALEIRQALGPHRVVDIWNGLTVLVAPYKQTGGGDVLIGLVNYAHQPLPVQLRVRGTFTRVRYESPEGPATLLPPESRDDHTEVVVPSLRVGGRLFFSR